MIAFHFTSRGNCFEIAKKLEDPAIMLKNFILKIRVAVAGLSDKLHVLIRERLLVKQNR